MSKRRAPIAFLRVEVLLQLQEIVHAGHRLDLQLLAVAEDLDVSLAAAQPGDHLEEGHRQHLEPEHVEEELVLLGPARCLREGEHTSERLDGDEDQRRNVERPDLLRQLGNACMRPRLLELIGRQVVLRLPRIVPLEARLLVDSCPATKRLALAARNATPLDDLRDAPNLSMPVSLVLTAKRHGSGVPSGYSRELC